MTSAAPPFDRNRYLSKLSREDGSNAPIETVQRLTTRKREDVVYLACRSWKRSTRLRSQRAFAARKRSMDPDLIADVSTDLQEAIERTLGRTLDGWAVAAPPPGRSAKQGRRYFAGAVRDHLAERTGMKAIEPFTERSREYHWGDADTDGRASFGLATLPTSPVLVIDDIATKGVTIRDAVRAIRAAGGVALAVVWCADEVGPTEE